MIKGTFLGLSGTIFSAENDGGKFPGSQFMVVVSRPPKEKDKRRHQTGACMIADEPIGPRRCWIYARTCTSVCLDHIYVLKIGDPHPGMFFAELFPIEYVLKA